MMIECDIMKNNRGQALVEFIIVLPVLLIIIMAIIDLGNIFGINAKKFITYMVNKPGSRNFSGGKLAFSVEAFDKVTTRNGNIIDFYKQGSKSRKNFSHNINELYKKLNNDIYKINKQYNKKYKGIEKITSNLPKNANDMYRFNINNSTIDDYMLGIQSIDTQKSIWDNLAMSWESMKSSATYALKNAFKF
jgi:hypothetical protein